MKILFSIIVVFGLLAIISKMSGTHPNNPDVNDKRTSVERSLEIEKANKAEKLAQIAQEPKLTSVKSVKIGNTSVRVGMKSDEIQDSLMPYMISDDSAGFVAGGNLTATYEFDGKQRRIVYGPNSGRGPMGIYEIKKIYLLTKK